MKKAVVVIVIAFVFNTSAQIEKMQKIAEFGLIPCGHFNALMDSAYQDYKQSLDSKLYVVFYGERYGKRLVWNKKTKKADKTQLQNPKRGDALNLAKQIPLYFETVYKVSNEKVILIDGGFKEDFEFQIWLVPKDAQPPKPVPTVGERNIIFREGKPFRTRNCAKAYEMYENPNF